MGERLRPCVAMPIISRNQRGSIVRVTAAEFIQGYGVLTNRALEEPVMITEGGRDRLVLVSAEEYQRLRRRDRRAVLAEELSDADLAAIAVAEVSPEHSHLDEELGDWSP